MKYLTLKIVDGIGVVTFDDPNSNMNVLNATVLNEFEEVVDLIDNNSEIKAAVLISGKDHCFIAGADIKLLRDLKDEAGGQEISRRGQYAFGAWERCTKPTIAAIRGVCLGGGMETALACHYRIAANHPKTVMATSEILLGLFPAGGAPQRLPPLIGIQAALDMMLTGRNIRSKKALKMGLVDDITIPWGLESSAIQMAKRIVDGKFKRRTRKTNLVTKLLEGNPLGRKLLFSQARKMIKAKTKGLYPSPNMIIDCVETGVNKGYKAGYELEIQHFGKITMTYQAKHLISLFFGQNALKKNRYGKPKIKTETVAVLGAGLMGAGIALNNTQKNIVTILKDLNLKALGRGLKHIYTELDKRVKRKAMAAFERDAKMARVYHKTNYDGFEKVDLVIEAVLEDLSLKHRVIREVEEKIKPECIFATNTSALPIAEIAKASARPENVIGMHYFSPVEKMPLLEVVIHEKNSKEACATAVEFGIRQGKTVIVVKDSPGFYTTRILAPYLDETIILGCEGVDLYAIDKALTKIGFPVGSVTLLDEVGIDTIAKIGVDLQNRYGGRLMAADVNVLGDMTDNGYTGRKGGKGFFDYQIAKKKRRVTNPEALAILKKHKLSKTSKDTEKDMQQRCLLRMVNEAIYCYHEGVLLNVVDGDVGAVFGLGFPPIYGGPFRYVDYIGADKVLVQLQVYEAEFGERFTPCPLLVEIANAGKKFYDKDVDTIISESMGKLKIENEMEIVS